MATAAKKRPAASSKSITSPIGGLNARDSYAAMPPQDAIVLDNFFCTPTTVDLRKGYSNWVTGLPGVVESIMPYRSATSQKLFAASGTSFYDVTSSGVVGAAVVTGLTNARWQDINFGTSGGQYLLNVNGSDKLRGYDGSAWWTDGDGTHDITGVDTSTIIHINSYKFRVFLVQKNSLKFWYLPVSAIAGAATSFDLSPLFKLGGYLMAMATWTIDNANGIQEYAIFLSSEGEVAMYSGDDPGSANAWSLVGMFRVGRPIGRRCFTRVGSDIIVISADGVFPLSKALLTDRYQTEDALSNKIVNLINNDVQSYGANFGWQLTLYPIGNKIIVNVPQVEGTTQYQYVMNTITGAWSRFTNWNASCFVTTNDVLYFGGNKVVCQCDTGYSDNGAYITGEVKTAFQYFGSPAGLKRWTMVRPIFNTSGTMVPSIRLDVDFENAAPTAAASFVPAAGTLWNTSLWNTFKWGANASIQKSWQGANGVGYAAAFHMKIVNNQSQVQWMSIDYVYERGGIL